MMEFHKLLAAKIETEKLDLAIPKTSMVEITTRPSRAKIPSSPTSP